LLEEKRLPIQEPVVAGLAARGEGNSVVPLVTGLRTPRSRLRLRLRLRRSCSRSRSKGTCSFLALVVSDAMESYEVRPASRGELGVQLACLAAVVLDGFTMAFTCGDVGGGTPRLGLASGFPRLKRAANHDDSFVEELGLSLYAKRRRLLSRGMGLPVRVLLDHASGDRAPDPFVSCRPTSSIWMMPMDTAVPAAPRQGKPS